MGKIRCLINIYVFSNMGLRPVSFCLFFILVFSSMFRVTEMLYVYVLEIRLEVTHDGKFVFYFFRYKWSGTDDCILKFDSFQAFVKLSLFPNLLYITVSSFRHRVRVTIIMNYHFFEHA